jgi:hypothetical protein
MQATLRDELSALLRRVLADLDPATEAGFLDRLEEVAIYRSGDDLVGFNSLRLVPVTLPNGRRTTEMVHLAALLPEHRGGNRSLLHVAWVGWRHWVRSGFRSFYYCCRMIHPSPFRLFVRFPDRSYPVARPTPKRRPCSTRLRRSLDMSRSGTRLGTW